MFSQIWELEDLLIQKYINEAPYTSTLTIESPGRVGCWVGWRIVNSYVDKNKTSLSDLVLLETQNLLKDSGYNP